MPEGDTVYHQASALRAVLAGKFLESTQFRVPQYATADLSGELVEEVLSRGKHLLIRAGETTIQSHLKMEGIWHVYPRSGARWKRPGHTARCVLNTAEHQAVGFSLGELHLMPRTSEDSFFADLGPDLLGPDWDQDEARRRLQAQPERSLGVALLDQRNLAGIGNVFRSEICFLSRLRPETPVGEVADLDSVLELSYRLLQINKNRSRRATTGSASTAVPLWTYGRGGKLCLRCQTPIIRYYLGEEQLRQAAIEDRSVYVCPYCQPARDELDWGELD